MINILLAEDDINLGEILLERLKIKGYDAVLATNGEEALKLFLAKKFDLLLLDVMMPLKDGFTLAKQIRAQGFETPIIFLTARSMKEDVIKGFELGADDYIVKPFSMEELIMRINAILKRSNAIKDANAIEEVEFKLSDTVFNSTFQTLLIKGVEYKMTAKEAELLRILCQSKDEIVSREYTLKKVWGEDTYFNGRSMDVFISKLRKVLANDGKIEILNVHGKGFKLICK